MIERSTKEGMHPRNRFRAGYDFEKLASASRSLARFVYPNVHGDASIDYSNPDAVKALNQALLQDAYGIKAWNIPAGYLTPPIPGRSDYIHTVADLLSSGGVVPRGASVAILDIGTGATCVYPLIGASEYGWRFVGSDIDERALDSARSIVAANPALSALVEFRHQKSAAHSFIDIVEPGEFFTATMCNPPFHASAREAEEASSRKRRNLHGPKGVSRDRNFGGRASELWCKGGELAFVLSMIRQSDTVRDQCRWFTTLVSKSENLRRLKEAAHDVGARDVRTIDLAQGQKKSRVLAWTFRSSSA